MPDTDPELHESRDFEIHEFRPEPHTMREYLTALWQKVNVIDSKVTATNGRVTRLEKFMYAVGGGLTVIGAVLVPLIVYFIAHLPAK